MHGTHTSPPPPPPTRYASSSIARVERTWQDDELGIFWGYLLKRILNNNKNHCTTTARLQLFEKINEDSLPALEADLLYKFLLEAKKNGDRMKLDSNKRTDDALGFLLDGYQQNRETVLLLGLL
jgi:hypothetical protein